MSKDFACAASDAVAVTSLEEAIEIICCAIVACTAQVVQLPRYASCHDICILVTLDVGEWPPMAAAQVPPNRRLTPQDRQQLESMFRADI